MADRLKLVAERRTEKGTRHCEALRKNGKMPAIVYGHKKEAVSISLDTHDFVEGLHHGHRLLDVSVDGKDETMLVKDLQYDHLGRSVIHADLVRVDLEERVTVEVGIELRGTARGTEEGAIVDQGLDALEIECKVTDIPESFQVDIRELEAGQVIHAKDVELPAGIKLMTDPEALVANCHFVSVAEEPEEGEEEVSAEPEVIGEKKEEQGGESSEGQSE